MAQAQVGYDFKKVLDTVKDDLLDYLELDPVLKELQNSGVFRPSKLRDLQEKNTTTTEKINALLQLVKEEDCSKYVQLKTCINNTGQEDLIDTIEAAEKGEYKPIVRKKPRTEEEKLLEVLKEDLVAYYREKESTMPVAPLVEQHDAELTKFYVRPPMMAYVKPNAFGQTKQSKNNADERTNIRSYRELFLNENIPFRKIYVTADAGMGKTSFAKMLAVTWCEAHVSKEHLAKDFEANCKNDTRKNTSPGDTHAASSYTDDLGIMETFDFLFLIKLRDFENLDKCSLDEMVFKMKSKLSHKLQYTEQLLENVLCNKQCLIIVDGLDEWTHPKSCRRSEIIPHRPDWTRCTVLTTTRPWKLSAARLSGKDIDRQVEIAELDETASHELESRAIEFLNENQRQNNQVPMNSNTKTVTDFESSVPNDILGYIFYIPYVLLQIICLWFGNSPIGNSLCEVYSNIIELTLTRWLVKTDLEHRDCEFDPSKEHHNIKLKCFENKIHCQRYMPLLLKIEELAFSTLFNAIQEDSLLFDKKQVLKYLKKEELESCLHMGLLSQVKDRTSLSEERIQLYFPHKTLHEFFCALFIATKWNNANTLINKCLNQALSNKCTSVSDILEMSKVFVFVCGLNPEVYSDISRHMATIVDTDQIVIDYRNMEEDASSLLLNYQDMQISCLQEATRNQHPECKIVIKDMVLDSSLYDLMKQDKIRALAKILSNSACSVKSLYVNATYEQEIYGETSPKKIRRIIKESRYPCLERLDVRSCKLTLIERVLATAANTLKYLFIYDLFDVESLSALTSLKNLRGLFLLSINVSLNTLDDISDCLMGCESMQTLKLTLWYYRPSPAIFERYIESINTLRRTVVEKSTLTTYYVELVHYDDNNGDDEYQMFTLKISRRNQ